MAEFQLAQHSNARQKLLPTKSKTGEQTQTTTTLDKQSFRKIEPKWKTTTTTIDAQLRLLLTCMLLARFWHALQVSMLAIAQFNHKAYDPHGKPTHMPPKNSCRGTFLCLPALLGFTLQLFQGLSRPILPRKRSQRRTKFQQSQLTAVTGLPGG